MESHPFGRRTAMTDTIRSKPSPRDPLERGRFTDGRTEFTVRASSESSPDSFQVFANGDQGDTVMIVSGIVSRKLHATWGDDWRAYAPEWKIWLEDTAFAVFYNVHVFQACADSPGTADDRSSTGSFRARFCDG